jgi:phosphoglycolate phosphatase-like HAD superfamily hydrolase
MRYKAVAFDWDGTLVNGFASRWLVVAMRNIFSSYIRPLYGVSETMEAIFFRPTHRLCVGARRAIVEAGCRGMLVGIATDRSLFSLVMSAEAVGLNLAMFDFIQCRRYVLNRRMHERVPARTKVLETGLKRERDAFMPLTLFLASNAILRHETLLIDDDERSVAAALKHGFHAMHITRNKPDFPGIWTHVDERDKAVRA